jgi:hypothetical protein
MIRSLSSGDERLSDDIDQLFELTRIMVLVLTGLIPSLNDGKSGGKVTNIDIRVIY